MRSASHVPRESTSSVCASVARLASAANAGAPGAAVSISRHSAGRREAWCASRAAHSGSDRSTRAVAT